MTVSANTHATGKNISVVTIVYNEAARIENLLQTLTWSDDIIVIDKSSTDGTADIARKYGCKVISVPFSETGGEVQFGVKEAKNTWVLFLTASDMIAPGLVEKLLALINNENFAYDIIAFPFVVQVFGFSGKWSPWDFPLKPWMFRKAVFSPSAEVHREISFSSKKVFKMAPSRIDAVFHMTHQSIDTFFERHIRYTRAEAKKFTTMGQGLRRTSWEIVEAILWMLFYKRVLFQGWKGLAFFFAFLSYFFMKYLYIWERFCGKGEERYTDMRAELLEQWHIKQHRN